VNYIPELDTSKPTFLTPYPGCYDPIASQPCYQNLSWREKLKNTITSWYFWANIVYFGYCIILLTINYEFTPQSDQAEEHAAALQKIIVDNYNENSTVYTTVYPAPAGYPVSDDDYYYNRESSQFSFYLELFKDVNRAYLGSAIIHLFNSLQYVHMWFRLKDPRTKKFYNLGNAVLVPEFFNVLEAMLYIVSASYYFQYQVTGANAFLDPNTLMVQKLEMAASTFALVASLGWWYSWWVTYSRGPGRGFTMDDPDFLSLIFITAPAVMYVVYNGMVQYDGQHFPNGDIDYIYQRADIIYFVGSVFYICVTLRDAGWFNSFFIFGWCAKHIRQCIFRYECNIANRCDYYCAIPPVDAPVTVVIGGHVVVAPSSVDGFQGPTHL